MSDAYAIETVDLCKTYDLGVEALRGLTLRVPRGSIFGFLGKNGAGKTTTIKVLLGMAYANRRRRARVRAAGRRAAVERVHPPADRFRQRRPRPLRLDDG
jgi:ABC-type multidrug transport system ATPase subunit